MAYPEVVTREEWLAARKRLLATEKVPGLSRFLRDGGNIFHTYST
jgi:hypothetical protein